MQQEIINASKKMRISYANEVEIRKVIGRVLVMVGVKEPPDDESTNMLIGFLLRRFSWITPEEMNLAFELAISGELEGCQPDAYNCLTTLYVSKMLAIYKKFKLKQLSGNTLSIAYSQDRKKQKLNFDDFVVKERRSINYAYQRFLEGEKDLYVPLFKLYQDLKKTIGHHNSEKGGRIFPYQEILAQALYDFGRMKRKETLNGKLPCEDLADTSATKQMHLKIIGGDLSVLWLFEYWKSEKWETVFEEI